MVRPLFDDTTTQPERIGAESGHYDDGTTDRGVSRLAHRRKCSVDLICVSANLTCLGLVVHDNLEGQIEAAVRLVLPVLGEAGGVFVAAGLAHYAGLRRLGDNSSEFPR
jgi:hypothetical protein